jgi:hypothetical protein
MIKKWRRIVVVFVVLTCTVGLLSLRSMNDRKAKAIAGWLRSQSLKSGESTNVKLPIQYKVLAARSSIDLVYRRKNKLAFFIKTTEGWKENYHGYVYVDPGYPLNIVKDSYGRGTIDLRGDGRGQDMVIYEKLSNNLYGVFFDLN